MADCKLYLYLARVGALDLYILYRRIIQGLGVEFGFALVEVLYKVDKSAVVLICDGFAGGQGDFFECDFAVVARDFLFTEAGAFIGEVYIYALV